MRRAKSKSWHLIWTADDGVEETQEHDLVDTGKKLYRVWLFRTKAVLIYVVDVAANAAMNEVAIVAMNEAVAVAWMLPLVQKHRMHLHSMCSYFDTGWKRCELTIESIRTSVPKRFGRSAV